MAIAIPEAAEAVTGGQAALGRAAAGPKVIRAERAASYESRTEAPRTRSAGRRQGPGIQPGFQPGRRRGGGRRAPGQYQPVILAEFLVAVLVVAIPPLATGGDQTAQAKQSPSPYSSDSMKQLVAIGAVYFILALMSGSKKLGRFSAWFGGLVLIGLGLLKTANGDLQALFKVFAPGLAAQQPGQETPQQMQAGAGLNPNAIINPFEQQANVTTVTPPPGGTGTITSDLGATIGG